MEIDVGSSDQSGDGDLVVSAGALSLARRQRDPRAQRASEGPLDRGGAWGGGVPEVTGLGEDSSGLGEPTEVAVEEEDGGAAVVSAGCGVGTGGGFQEGRDGRDVDAGGERNAVDDEESAGGTRRH